MSHQRTVSRWGRLPSRIAPLVLFVTLAACQDSSTGEALGPDDPSGEGQSPLFERLLVGSGDRMLARQAWVWNPRSEEWALEPYLLPAPGVGEGTIGRAIRRDLPTSANGWAGSPTNVEGDAALFVGGFGLDGAAAGDHAYFYDGATEVTTALRLNRRRVDHAVTALYGSRFLVVGGHDATLTPSATAETFDAATKAFETTGSMATPRAGHAASLLPDGRVLVTGGRDQHGRIVRQAELWDPATGLFSEAGTTGSPRTGHSQVTLVDGRVVVVGGEGTTDAEIWDPVIEDFISRIPLISRHGAGNTATLLLDGRVLVLGGDGNAGRPQATDQAELFDPDRNTFALVGPMNSARMGHFAVLTADGAVLIGGGIDESGFATANAETFDPRYARFRTIDRVPAAGTSPAAVFIADAN